MTLISLRLGLLGGHSLISKSSPMEILPEEHDIYKFVVGLTGGGGHSLISKSSPMEILPEEHDIYKFAVGLTGGSLFDFLDPTANL